MTVNRVFRPGARVKPANREKVLAAAKKYGYQPNAIVSMGIRARNTELSDSITGTLAWVHGQLKEDDWRTLSHLKPIYNGAVERAKELGFGLDSFWLNEKGMTPARLSGIILNRGIRGVIVAPIPKVMVRLRLTWSEFACASLNHDGWRPLLHRVASDTLYTMSLSWKRLRKAGYKRIGFVIPRNMDLRHDFAYSSRFRFAQDQIPAKERVPILFNRKAAITEIRADFLRWFRHHRPEVVICNDIRTKTILEEEGVQIPQDVGLCHLSVAPDVADWTGMKADQKSAGQAVVDVVVNQLVRNEFGIPKHPREVVLRSKWQQGKTTYRMVGESQ